MPRSAAPRPTPKSAPQPRLSPRWLQTAILLAAGLLLFAWFSRQISDPDFWWHLKFGEYIVQNRAMPAPDPFAYTTYMGQPAYAGEEMVRYFNLTHEWLAQVLVYLAYAAGGFPGVILFRQFQLFAVCGLVGLIVHRRTGGFYRPVLAAIATAMVAAVISHDRPHLITFVFLTAAIAILEHRRWVWALPPLLLVWANCHSGFFLGWVAMGAYCAEALFQRWRGRPDPGERRLLLATGASMLASGLNPDGFRVFQVLLLYRDSPMQSGILEWQRPKYWEASTFTALLYAAGAMLLWARGKARISDWILYALFAVAALAAVRNIILVGIMAPVILASYFPWKKRAIPATAGYLLLAVLLAAAISRISTAGLRLEASRWMYPSGAAEFLLQHKVPGRMFNAYEHGGYLIWRLWPHQRVFMDGRALNESVYADGRRIAYNAEKDSSGLSGEELLDKYGIQVILMPMLDPAADVYLLPAALADPVQKEWKLVYRDMQAVVFMRQPPPGVQPLNSLEALNALEDRCRTILAGGGAATCARSVANLFARIGDRHRANLWMHTFNQLPNRFHEPIEVLAK